MPTSPNPSFVGRLWVGVKSLVLHSALMYADFLLVVLAWSAAYYLTPSPPVTVTLSTHNFDTSGPTISIVVLVALISAYRYFCFRFLQGTVAQRLFHWSVVSDDLGPLSRPRSAIRALEGVTVGAAFMTYFGPIPLGLASLWLMIDLTPVLVSRSHQTLLGNLSRTLIVPRPRHWTYEKLLSHRRHLEEF